MKVIYQITGIELNQTVLSSTECFWFLIYEIIQNMFVTVADKIQLRARSNVVLISRAQK